MLDSAQNFVDIHYVEYSNIWNSTDSHLRILDMLVYHIKAWYFFPCMKRISHACLLSSLCCIIAFSYLC
jgi:hypothetical protein